MFCVLISAICLILAVPNQARKYDIEAESLKLYKEDFQTALMRFRRTPEYLKILGDRESEFWVNIMDMQNQITYFHLSQLSVKVKELVGLSNTPSVKSLKDSSNSNSSASFRSGFVYRRMLDDPNNKTAVERLDSYSKLASPLNLAQRNAMKDLGFQYAGDVIHSLIKNLGPDTTGSEKSTKQPGGGDSKESRTTEHVHMHIVTTTTEAPVVEEEKLDNEEVQGDSKENEETDPSVPGQKKHKRKLIV